MLSALDESFLHQSPLTFDQTAISDHRFFDRMWLGSHTKEHLHIVLGLAAYKNTNTFDGFFTFIRAGKQYNLRLSRPLLPDSNRMGVGPIDVQIVRPLQEIRIVVSPGSDHPFAADLTFFGSVPASLEAPHQSRVDGRITQDYNRFDQLGRLNGWVELDGERIEVSDWFAARDHSWGLRPGFGGYEPTTSLPREGENPTDVGVGSVGFLFLALWFEVPSMAGYLIHTEDGKGNVKYSHGRLLRKSGEEFVEIDVRGVAHDLTFVPGTRTVSHGVVTIETADGERLSVEMEPLIAPICYKGTGYDSGFNDERGLGVHRGNVLETDVLDISHAEDVMLPDGRVVRPWHRELGGVIRLNGEEGMAHCPVLTSGPIERYGLSQPTTNKRS